MKALAYACNDRSGGETIEHMPPNHGSSPLRFTLKALLLLMFAVAVGLTLFLGRMSWEDLGILISIVIMLTPLWIPFLVMYFEQNQ